MSKRLPEFPSDWHQERYVEDLKRELEGCKRRRAELEAMDVKKDDRAWLENESGLEAVTKQLARFERSKRPRGSKKKETR